MTKRPWGVHALGDMYSPNCQAGMSGSKYAYAVALPYDGNRLVAAWWVLTGRAYALRWPQAGELEAAVGMPLYDRSTFKPTGKQKLGNIKRALAEHDSQCEWHNGAECECGAQYFAIQPSNER